MSYIFNHDVKRDGHDAAPISEAEPLIVGMDERTRRKRFRRRFCVWLFSAIALIFVGQAMFATIFAYKISHNIECVPYEGGTTVVKIPIHYPRSAVLVDSSVSSNDVSITRVESESNEITFTIEEASELLEETAEFRLCTLKGRKLTGLGIFAAKKDRHEAVALPVIKSLKIQVPNSIPPPSISLLAPRRHCSKAAKFLKWAGVWNPNHKETEKLDVSEMFD